MVLATRMVGPVIGVVKAGFRETVRQDQLPVPHSLVLLTHTVELLVEVPLVSKLPTFTVMELVPCPDTRTIPPGIPQKYVLASGIGAMEKVIFCLLQRPAAGPETAPGFNGIFFTMMVMDRHWVFPQDPLSDLT